MVSQWELENSDATTQSDDDVSDDDLCYPRAAPKRARYQSENDGIGGMIPVLFASVL